MCTICRILTNLADVPCPADTTSIMCDVAHCFSLATVMLHRTMEVLA